MAKQDVVAAQKAAFVSGQDAVIESALGATYDAGFTDGQGTVGPSQADLDAANAKLADVQAKYSIDEQELTAIRAVLAPAQS